MMTYSLRFPILLVLIWLFSAGSTYAADSGTLSENTPLHDQPDGQVIATLLANTLVEVGQRRGGWYPITASGGRQGWVRIGAVRFAGQSSSDSVFGGLWGWLNSSRSSASGGTATAGIRGFDSEQLQAAEANYPALDSLNAYATDAEAARRFAAALKLQARQVADIKGR